MKKILSLLFCIALLVQTSGCVLFRNPMSSWFSSEKAVATQQANVDKVTQQIQNNETNQVTESKSYIYGTKLSLLAEPSSSPAHALATQFNDKAIAILGTPSLEDINKLQTTVNNLLSTNQTIILKGEKQLAAMDLQVEQLQSEKTNLQTQLAVTESKWKTAENKLLSVGTSNSTLAQKWSDLVKWFWWVVIGIGVIIALRIVAAACPPPYNSVVQVIAIPFTWIIHAIEACVPEALSAAGWVEKEYKTATQDLVNSIQALKTANPTLHASIATTVAANVSDASVPVIQSAKASQGIVS